MTFQIGDAVTAARLDEFTWHERRAIEGRIGRVTDVSDNYYEVHFDEDIEGPGIIVKNDILFREDELEAV